ncbi:hypothetical protein EG328_003848 [Venturia inaequalis]|uniref:Major facilitator superfamily (MFS) profile domain-containing protein n=1 Tax=Venturia inaequalis TaxID=5025 RepID=A0A8H3VG10_VENIN|nr:hypothetical protein EG328_003848 [Venturia inaequalis]RDI80248.1 hypothetical protein Vi05172_g9732 [Venturia inaequalis]
MNEKGDPAHSTTEKPESTGSDIEREPNQEKDLESVAGIDKESEKEADEKAENDPNIVDWDGEDDPMNPLNWTPKKKWIIVGLLSLMTLVTPLASVLFTPAIPEVMKDFKSTNSTLASFVVSVYILGYAFGPMLLAPLSEMYGRTIVYHVTNILFVGFTVGCALSTNMGMLIAFRFLTGVCGSCPITIGGGTVADLFRTEQRGAAMAAWSLGPLIGPVIGPVGGAYLGQAKGWRWDFWVLVIAGGAVTVAKIVVLRETYAPVLLKRKTERLRQESGNDQLRSKYDEGLTNNEFLKRAIIRPMKMLFLSPLVFILSLYMAIVYGYLYLLFTTMTEVFETKYKFHGGTVGLAYLGIGIGMFLGLIISGSTSDKLVIKLTARNGGQQKPEYRLPLMAPAASTIPIGLFIYGWSAQYSIHWIVPIIGTAFVGAGMITTFMPVTMYLTDSFTLYAASVLAATTVLRSLVGALLPLAGPAMYKAMGLGWGNSLLGFLAAAMIPLPILFYKYGERIRTSKRFNVTF